MKSLNTARTLGIARAALTMAALTLASCSANDLTNQQEVASLSSTAQVGEYCTRNVSSHVLSLEDAHGKPFKLVHSPGYGWKYVAGQRSEAGDSAFGASKVELSPVPDAHAETTIGVPTADPMAVFIDGLTGYTFAWTRDTGWKFVGHVTDGQP